MHIQSEEQNTHTGRTGCILLASGFSRRFGANKLLADFHGKKLIEWPLDILQALLSEERLYTAVVVTRYPEIAALCKQRNIPFVLHALPDRNDTIRLGLEAIGERIDACMFCPADQPLLSKETLSLFIEKSGEEKDRILRASFEELAGMPVLFPKTYFADLKQLPKGSGGREILRAHPERILPVPALRKEELMDVDTPDALTELLNLL